MLSIPPIYIAVAGLLLLVLLIAQSLIGLRKIKFKGPLHWKVHRWFAWLIIAFAAVHGLTAMLVFGIIRL